MVRKLKGAKNWNLDDFFLAQTDEVECPLGTIVTKKYCGRRKWVVFLAYICRGLC